MTHSCDNTLSSQMDNSDFAQPNFSYPVIAVLEVVFDPMSGDNPRLSFFQPDCGVNRNKQKAKTQLRGCHGDLWVKT